MMPRTSCVLLAACAMLAPSRGNAQADVYAPTVLQIAPTPRAATLGSVTAVRDVEAIFENPAMIGVATGTVAGVGRFDAATHVTIASSTSLGNFSVGVGAQYLDAMSQSNVLPFWSYALQVGGHLSTSSTVGAFALSTTFRSFRVGAAAKYVEQRIGNVRDAAPSLDLGLAKDVSRYTIGVTLQNIGDGIDMPVSGAHLPFRVSAGVASYGWTVGAFDVNGSAGASVMPDGVIAPAAGLELGYSPLEGYSFSLRAGLRRPELRAQQPLSFGGSAGLDRFSIEYAYEDWVNGGTHRLALRVR